MSMFCYRWLCNTNQVNFNTSSKKNLACKLKIEFASGFLMTAAHIGSLPLESVAAYIAPPLVGCVPLAAHLSPTAAYMWLWHVACGSKYVHSTTSGPPLLGAHLSPTATNCLPLAPRSPCPGATCPAVHKRFYSLLICVNLTFTYFWPKDRSFKNIFLGLLAPMNCCPFFLTKNTLHL